MVCQYILMITIGTYVHQNNNISAYVYSLFFIPDLSIPRLFHYKYVFVRPQSSVCATACVNLTAKRTVTCLAVCVNHVASVRVPVCDLLFLIVTYLASVLFFYRLLSCSKNKVFLSSPASPYYMVH